MAKVEYMELPIEKIQVAENVRTETDSDLAELMESIKQHGLLEPIGVWQTGGQYVLSYGHRRLTACKKLGWTKIPALVSDEKIDEAEFLVRNSVENLQRKDISPTELGRIIKRLRFLGLSEDEVCVRLGINKNRYRVAVATYEGLPETYQDYVGFKDNRSKGQMKTAGIVGSTVGRYIATSGLPSDIKAELIKKAKSEELNERIIPLIIRLLKAGIPLDQALEEYKKYTVKNFHIVIDKEKLKEYEAKNGKLTKSVIVDILVGKRPPIPGVAVRLPEFA